MKKVPAAGGNLPSCHDTPPKIPLTEGVRLIGVTASRLGPPLSMASLFSEDRDKRNRAAAAMDEIQARFGRKALQKGFWLEEKK